MLNRIDLKNAHLKYVIESDGTIGRIWNYDYNGKTFSLHCRNFNEKTYYSTLFRTEEDNKNLNLKIPEEIKKEFTFGRWIEELNAKIIDTENIIII